jgi:hypothetical protein
MRDEHPMLAAWHARSRKKYTHRNKRKRETGMEQVQVRPKGQAAGQSKCYIHLSVGADEVR